MSSRYLCRRFRINAVEVEVYRDRQPMGEAAGRAGAGILRRTLEDQDGGRLVFGSAPSQETGSRSI